MAKTLKSFPSISTLVNETIAETRQIFWRLVSWNVVSFLWILFISLIGGVAIGAGVTGLSIFAQNNQPSVWIAVGIIIALLVAFGIIGFLFLSVIPQIGSIFIVSELPERRKFRQIFAISWKKAWPVLAATLLCVPIILGGFFLFIIPGILLSLWVSFAMYEVILKNLKPWAAIRRSIAVWQTYGNQIFVRMLVPTVVSWLLGNISPMIGEGENMPLAVAIVIISVVLNVLVNIWAIVFMVRLYQHSSALVPANTQPKMGRVWIMAGLGWLFTIGTIIALVRFSMSPAGQEFFSSAATEFSQELEAEYESDAESFENEFQF